jgi:hypothetical protein
MAGAHAASGKCFLQVAGTIYLNSRCNVEVGRDGSVSIGVGDAGRSTYFAIVDVDALTGNARGFWNGREASSHAHEELGALIKSKDCWVDRLVAPQVRLCATLKK